MLAENQRPFCEAIVAAGLVAQKAVAKGAIDPHLSRDGKKVAFVRDGELFVVEIATAAGRPTLGRNFDRAAELTDVPQEEILRIFQDLEPVAAIGNVGYTKNKIPEKRNAEPVLAHIL